MMGRLKPILNALSEEDHLQYRAHYCGICVTTKRSHGRRASLGHSSEMVFVSLLLEGLAPETYHSEQAGCTVLPVLRKSLAMGDSRTGKAVASGLLAALQLDIRDAREDRERWIKQFLCRSLARKRGAIHPAKARDLPFVREALRGLPRDEVAEVVAGVVGSVFSLAGADADSVTTGCRIGHVLGRLMNLSDAVEDYFGDLRAGRPNPLFRERAVDASEVEMDLLGLLDELEELVDCLVLRRNADLIDSLINVHARARVEKTLLTFREKLGAASGNPNKGTTLEGHGAPVSLNEGVA